LNSVAVLVLGVFLLGIFNGNNSNTSASFQSYSYKKNLQTLKTDSESGKPNIAVITAPENVPQVNVAANLSYSDYESTSETKAGSNPLSYQLDYSLVTESFKMNDYQKISSYILTNYQLVQIEDALVIAESIVKFSQEVSLDPKLIAAVISVESEFNKEAVSPTGAKGLGQIMPFNFSSLKISNPYDIVENVRATTYYLREKFAHWNNDDNQISLGLASYTEGYGAVKNANKQYKESTQRYINKILKNYQLIQKV